MSGKHTREIEPWFLRHGLPWFVPGERERARAALRPRRTVPVVVLVGLAAVGAAVGLTWLTGKASFAPATLTLIAVLAVLVYGVTALRARPLVTWAVRRTLHSARQLVPMVTRALPLLLLFVTFLFINGEVWDLSAELDGSVLWLTTLLFAGVAVLFLLVRLPEEVDRVDDALDASLLLRATRGTPIEAETARLLRERPDLPLERYGDVPGWERRNLILVLLVTQAAQVLLLALSVFGFFLVFGGVVMTREVQEGWVGGEIHALPWLTNLSVELVQVSVFLAAFSGLYFAVGVITDDTYREQFFSEVLAELERAVGVRAAYLALREESGDDAVPEDSLAPAAVGDPGERGAPVAHDAVPAPDVDHPAGPVPAPAPAPEPLPEPDEVRGHWGFRQDRADDISAGVVTGELLLLRDGRLFRRYGGPSFRHGRTRWDFGPWHAFTGWQPVEDEDRARLVLGRRGYELHLPGPLGVSEREGGPFEGAPPEPEPLP